MGRYPKRKEDRKRTFQTSLVETDYQKFESISEDLGLSVGTLARELILEGLKYREREDARKMKNVNAKKIKDRILQQYQEGTITREDAETALKNLWHNMRVIYLGYGELLDKVDKAKQEIKE
jgi:hypothetical protein